MVAAPPYPTSVRFLDLTGLFATEFSPQENDAARLAPIVTEFNQNLSGLGKNVEGENKTSPLGEVLPCASRVSGAMHFRRVFMKLKRMNGNARSHGDEFAVLKNSAQ